MSRRLISLLGLTDPINWHNTTRFNDRVCYNTANPDEISYVTVKLCVHYSRVLEERGEKLGMLLHWCRDSKPQVTRIDGLQQLYDLIFSETLGVPVTAFV